MGRRGYPPEFRRKVVDLVEAGRSVADVTRDLGGSVNSRSTPGVGKPASTVAWYFGASRRGAGRHRPPTVATRRSSGLLTWPLTVRGDLRKRNCA